MSWWNRKYCIKVSKTCCTQAWKITSQRISMTTWARISRYFVDAQRGQYIYVYIIYIYIYIYIGTTLKIHSYRHKGQRRGALMFNLIFAWTNCSGTIETPVIWDVIALITTSLSLQNLKRNNEKLCIFYGISCIANIPISRCLLRTTINAGYNLSFLFWLHCSITCK